MILLEHVLTCLTGCVTTYSDLQNIINGLNTDPPMGACHRIQWVRKHSSLTTIVNRLQNQKSSLTLMLTIIQWYGRLHNLGNCTPLARR